MKEERFPYTRKPFCRRRLQVVEGEASEPWRRCNNRGAEGKAERFPHGGSVPTCTHQTEWLICSPTGAGGGWELSLWLWSDPRERTAVDCGNTA